MKTCVICSQEIVGRHGHAITCSDVCSKKRERQVTDDYKPNANASRRARYAANPARQQEANRRYKESNPELFQERSRQWRDEYARGKAALEILKQRGITIGDENA